MFIIRYSKVTSLQQTNGKNQMRILHKRGVNIIKTIYDSTALECYVLPLRTSHKPLTTSTKHNLTLLYFLFPTFQNENYIIFSSICFDRAQFL